LAYYTALAGSPIIVSVLGYSLADQTVNRWLISLRLRLHGHQAVVTTVVVALIGVVLVGVGLRGV
jgi:hypothetical protein